MNRAITDAGPSRFPPIDGLRALAALLVVIAHFLGGAVDVLSPDVYAVLQRFPFYTNGIFGVDIFFAISGFLITRIIVINADAQNFFAWFYFRRALRILPVAFAGICLAVFLGSAFGYPFTPSGVAMVAFSFGNLKQLAALTDPGVLELKGSLAHYWTLAVEEQFYFIWPLLFVWLRPIRTRVWLIASIILMSIGVRTWLHLFWPAADLHGFAHLSTVARLDSLAIGALAALASLKLPQTSLTRAAAICLCLCPAVLLFRHGLSVSIVEGVVTAGFVALAVIVARGGVYPAAVSCAFLVVLFQLDQPGPITHAVAGAASAALILLLLGSQSIWNRVLSSPPMRFIGRISYGLYVYHAILFDFSPDIVALLPEAFRPSGWDFIILRLVIVFAVAAASWYLIEAPILSMKVRYPLQGGRVGTRDLEPLTASVIGVLIFITLVFTPSLGSSFSMKVNPLVKPIVVTKIDGTAAYSTDVPPGTYDIRYLIDGNPNTSWHSPPGNLRDSYFVELTLDSSSTIGSVGLDSPAAFAARPKNIQVSVRDADSRWHQCAPIRDRRITPLIAVEVFPLVGCDFAANTVRLTFDDTRLRMIQLSDVRLYEK